jgi:hypothetical protein
MEPRGQCAPRTGASPQPKPGVPPPGNKHLSSPRAAVMEPRGPCAPGTGGFTATKAGRTTSREHLSSPRAAVMEPRGPCAPQPGLRAPASTSDSSKPSADHCLQPLPCPPSTELSRSSQPNQRGHRSIRWTEGAHRTDRSPQPGLRAPASTSDSSKPSADHCVQPLPCPPSTELSRFQGAQNRAGDAPGPSEGPRRHTGPAGARCLTAPDFQRTGDKIWKKGLKCWKKPKKGPKSALP